MCVCVFFFHGIHMHSHISSTEFWNYEKTQIKAQPLSNQTSVQSWCVECWNAQQVFSNDQYAQSGLPLVSMAWFSSYIPREHISLTSINAMFPFITWLYVLDFTFASQCGRETICLWVLQHCWVFCWEQLQQIVYFARFITKAHQDLYINLNCTKSLFEFA